MSSESISVIIPTYCREELIRRALDSALRQCLPDDEVIVVDDGSTDGTRRALKPYADRIRYLWCENQGAGHARNLGVASATNGLIAFLDSDDEWMPHKLALQRALMAACPDLVMSFSDFAITRASDGSEERRYLGHWHRDPRSWDEILPERRAFSSLARLPDGYEDFQVHFGELYRDMARALYVPTTTVIVRKALAGAALHFDEDLPTFEDWGCFGRICGAGRVAFLDTETSWQHGHAGSRLTDADTLTRTTTRLALLERVWAADRDFVAAHGEYLSGLIERERRGRALQLIRHGRMAEAREELARLRRAPLPYRIAAALPGSLARPLFAALVQLRRLALKFR